MNVLELTLDQIHPGTRLRSIDDDQARLIGLSMKEDGQQTPIEVRDSPGGPRPYRLVAGGHRYRGAQLFELPTILATLFTGTDLQAQLREIDENLIRHELTALDRAVFLWQRQDIYEKLHPESRKQARLKRGAAAPDPRSANIAERAFSADAAARLGWSERTVTHAIALAKALAPDVRAAIAGTMLANNGSELKALSRATPQQQMQAVNMLLHPQNRRAANVADALRMVRGQPEPTDTDGAYRALIGAWRKANAVERGRFVDFLVAERSVARIKPRVVGKGEAA